MSFVPVAWNDLRRASRLIPQWTRPDPAERLLTRHARTFAFAASWLPPARRRSVVVLYAFCRTLDDLVDEPAINNDPGRVADELAAWRAWLLAGLSGPAPHEPLGGSLAAIQAEYTMPVECFLDLIDGLGSDLAPGEYATVAQLRRYCYQVAGTVGIAMAHVLGASSSAALAAAEDLGIAMQLTNILRDVGADLADGRLYLPLDDLAQAGSSRSHLADLLRAGRGPDPVFRALMRRQVARSYAWYEPGLPGIELLPADCRLPIRLAAQLYRQILTVIERNDYDVLRRRAATTPFEKVVGLGQALAATRRPARAARQATQTERLIEGDGSQS